ncbi:hypothetical protein [Amycolatopsis sp. NPDC049159]|uniref:hypothetical protein n=1 Tax=Amycolatopsis sp. NPDC049159 TaxID=3157210 RepID=UPI0034000245
MSPQIQQRPPDAVPRTTPAITVKVFFHRGQPDDPSRAEAVTRTVPKTDAVAAAAVTQLLGGPTSAERQRGYFSMFSPATADMLKPVRIANGGAHADFRDFRLLLPNATSSCRFAPHWRS